MRIAFITPEYVSEKNFDGGLSNYLGRVCSSLAKMGHNISVFVVSDRNERFYSEGVEVHKVANNPFTVFWGNKLTLNRLRSTIIWLLQSRALNRACAQIHHEEPFDLIQYASYTGTAFFRINSVPAVVRISSYEPMWQKAYSFQKTVNNRLRRWIEKRAICKCDALFGPSHSIAKIIEQETGRIVKVIEPPFFFNPDHFDHQTYKDQLSCKKYLLFFGSLGELKGVHIIAEIVERVLLENKDLYFVFVGKCFNYKGRPAIEYVLDKAGQERHRVLYLGQMKHNQLYPILKNAYAVLLPSLVDNLPNTCIEAMAFKRIVVGSHDASFDQLIDPGVSGFLCENNSSQSLYEEIRKIFLLSEEERKMIGEAAARRIELLKPEHTLKKLIQFYEGVIGRG